MVRKILIFLVIVLSAFSISNASVLYVVDDELEQRKEVVRILFKDLGLPNVVMFDPKTMVPLRKDVHLWTLEENEEPNKRGSNPDIHAYPRWHERILRSSVSKFEIIQQPETVLLQSGASVIPVQNPDSVLFRYSVVTNYGELIPSVSDVQAQADAIKSYGTDKNSICGDPFTTQASEKGLEKKLNCILRIGVANRFGRALSGTKGTFNYGQNPKVQQNLIVTGTAAANKNFSLSGQVDFDPKNLFLTGTDWKTAYSTAQIYGRDMEVALRQKIGKVCNQKKN